MPLRERYSTPRLRLRRSPQTLLVPVEQLQFAAQIWYSDVLISWAQRLSKERWFQALQHLEEIAEDIRFRDQIESAQNPSAEQQRNALMKCLELLQSLSEQIRDHQHANAAVTASQFKEWRYFSYDRLDAQLFSALCVKPKSWKFCNARPRRDFDIRERIHSLYRRSGEHLWSLLDQLDAASGLEIAEMRNRLDGYLSYIHSRRIRLSDRRRSNGVNRDAVRRIAVWVESRNGSLSEYSRSDFSRALRYTIRLARYERYRYHNPSEHMVRDWVRSYLKETREATNPQT